ncbi:MAG: MFS transporter [Pirellulales bacterium]|nr:MFS transporter [Pirellulales bacterium]
MGSGSLRTTSETIEDGRGAGQLERRVPIGHDEFSTKMKHWTTRSSNVAQSMTWPHWRLVLLLMTICYLAHFNRQSMPVAGDLRIMETYGISPTQMGLVYSAFLATYTLFMIPGGWLIDRTGPKFALQLMCLGSAVFVVLTGLVGLGAATMAVALPSLIVVRGAMGLISAPLHPAAANAVSLGIPVLQRSAANGMVTGAALLGIASTYVVFGGMIDWLTWEVAFVAAGVATIVVGMLWTVFAPPRETPATADARSPAMRPSAARTAGFFRRNKNLILVTISYSAVGYFQYLFFYWMHYYFKDVLKLGDEQSRWYATIPPLAMACGMPLGGWLSDRIQSLFGWRAARGGMAASAMVASSVLLLLGVQARQPLWIVAWMSLALGVLGMLEGPFWVTAVEVGGNRGGLSAGIFNTGGNVGGIVAPLFTPWISIDLGYGWPAGLAVGSIVCLIGAALWFWIDAPRPIASALNFDAPLSPACFSRAEPIQANCFFSPTHVIPFTA